jgi:integron integrase
MGKPEIEAFLSHLATNRRVAASTQRQALNALIFLYRHVLDKPVEDKIAPVKAKRRRRPPVELTKNEVCQVLNQMRGTHLLMAKIMYGGGLRLMECLRLRVMDLDFAKAQVYVRGKVGKDRLTILAPSINKELEKHLSRIKKLHEADLDAGHGKVYLPEALARKYRNAAREYRWQYVFPAKKLSKDPRSDVFRRHHVLESGLQKAVKVAVDRAGITKCVSSHTFRHSFATHLLEDGVNIRIVQELMGHADVKTTEIYTHVMEKDLQTVRSPLETL